MQTPKGELIGIGPAVLRRLAARELRNVVTELEATLKRLLPTPRGVLQCKLNIEPWVAMKHLVDNVIDDVSVPKAGGGMTKWSTDCFEFVVLLRIYAFWRSLTQVIWSNKDATAQCTKDANLSFCAYMNENTTKVGDGKYAAHPFGVVDEHTIVTELAKAVVGDPIPRGYIQKNIFISAMRQPGD